MPKRRAAPRQAKTSCNYKKKVEEVIVVDSDSDDVTGGDVPVVRVESDYPSGDGDTPAIAVDSDHHSDSAVAEQDCDDSDDSDEFPSFEAIMHRSLTGKKLKKEKPEDVPAAASTSLPQRAFPSVDPMCKDIGERALVCGGINGPYSVMLTQTCLQKNMNKFYTMQILYDPRTDKYYFWSRCGRVGERGACSLTPCNRDLTKAKIYFERRFFLKTKNDWSNHLNFVKHPGKYDMVKVDYTEPDAESEDIKKRVVDLAKDTVKSRLEPSLKSLMALISNVEEMQQNIIDMNFDVIKMPLGKLQTEQIREGYKALRWIEDCIYKSSSEQELMDACSMFYTCIPHSFSRSQRPEMIRTNEDVRMKMRLLEALEDIETAMALLKKDMQDHYKHPLDNFYTSLGCELTEIGSSDLDYQLILWAIRNTHGKTHVDYKLVVENVFRVHKASQKFFSVGNHRMLWHGSRTSNFAGILSKGLCIAPPDVPANGYMFGKGIYFADCVSKSANYSISEQGTNEGLLVLCEVSLGNVDMHMAAKPRGDLLPFGKHSVMGVGQFFPIPLGDFNMKNGVLLSCGKLVRDPEVKSELLYNEYIVYNTSQVKMAYLVKVKFDWLQNV